MSSLEFNLSQLKVLRSLEVEGWGYDFAPTRHTIVTEVYLTITSPVFSELVIIIRANEAAFLPSGVKLFETLRTMDGIRPFKLVFLLVAPDSSLGKARRILAGALGLVTAKGLLNFLDSPPTIRSGRFRERWWEASY
jgi:hypothetical protein